MKRYSDVVLLSGGVDSSYLAFTIKPERSPAMALFVDYGQPAAKKEERSARVMAKAALLDFGKVSVHGLPLGDMSDWETGAAVVPARNLWLIAIGAAYGDRVWIGCVPEDFEDYADCRPKFLHDMGVAMNRAYGATVAYSPATRAERVNFLRENELDPFAWSCYGPGPKPCGQCASCSQ